MKKLIAAFMCILLMSFCSCMPTKPAETIVAQSTTTVTTEESMITDEQYSHIIKELHDLFTNSPIARVTRYYATYDIDGNGTKELLFGDDTHLGTVLTALYAVQNGVFVQQETITPWMEQFDARRWLFKNGIIKLECKNDMGRGYPYFRFEAGELKFQIGVGITNGEYTCIYPEDLTKEVSITKEEFDRVQKEMEGDGQVVEIDWKPLAEYEQ